ncbi:MAG: VOC family protein [Candidatus Eremiobacteraeota bacterium]|nr:VOC family protein [Candidatus Eremiobacteraeota bacterium]MBV8354308.1 VOC family protein [Candidatus Eremiobacteraeota bacterium]
MPNPVTHFEVVGKDAKKLQNFYKGAFDWQVDPVMDFYAMAMPGEGINGGIGAAPPDVPEMAGAPVGVCWYVEVQNLEKTLAQIEKLGGKTIMPPADVPGGPRIAKFADPEGHVIGLTQAHSGG